MRCGSASAGEKRINGKGGMGMGRNKGLLYFGIASVYIFFFFVLITRFIFSFQMMSRYTEWLMSEPFLVKAALWSPLVIGLICLYVYVSRRFYKREKEEKDIS